MGNESNDIDFKDFGFNERGRIKAGIIVDGTFSTSKVEKLFDTG